MVGTLFNIGSKSESVGELIVSVLSDLDYKRIANPLFSWKMNERRIYLGAGVEKSYFLENFKYSVIIWRKEKPIIV